MSRVESESEPQLAPLAEWAIPLPPGGTIRIDAFSGHAVTIVGANGAGKSALATWMVARRPAGTVKRLIAHRRIWFSSSGPEISPAQRESQSKNADIWDRQNESRYLDHLDGQRASIALFDLLGMINDQNRQAVELYDDGSSTEVVRSVTGERLLPRLNRILANAGLHVAMSVTPVQTFSARHAGLGVEYPIYQMSDGEKSALLLAAEVLTAARG
ncbi:ATP-binding cassette domain-containing protein [Microbacterium schleiferi]|uniref:ATP-binding cassette domain-containing protein n=1 Tax=Microbacterium schleiferi TaxID=69362 RepID=A0A7S8RHS3_9MICO|nr:ATP-binding cassette domain-containing protein [Microbacterium schleiferi]QPE04697.1 ATP-binding cassette domain-containing protein [Microbacterium schleiferi]